MEANRCQRIIKGQIKGVFAISKLGWIKQQQRKFRSQERETPRVGPINDLESGSINKTAARLVAGRSTA
jgi:hypothetical protein